MPSFKYFQCIFKIIYLFYIKFFLCLRPLTRCTILMWLFVYFNLRVYLKCVIFGSCNSIIMYRVSRIDRALTGRSRLNPEPDLPRHRRRSKSNFVTFSAKTNYTRQRRVRGMTSPGNRTPRLDGVTRVFFPEVCMFVCSWRSYLWLFAGSVMGIWHPRVCVCTQGVPKSRLWINKR